MGSLAALGVGGAPAPAARAAIFNGTSSTATRAFSGSPYTAVTDWSWVWSIRSIDSSAGTHRILYNNPAGPLYITSSTFLEFTDFSNTLDINLSGHSDVVFRLSRVSSTGVVTMQAWDRGTGTQIGTNQTLTSSTGAQDWTAATVALFFNNDFNSQFLAGHVDWIGWSSTASNGSTKPGTPDSSYDLGRWLFDSDNGNDTSANAQNLTLTNVTFENEP